MKKAMDYFTPPPLRGPAPKWWEYVRDVLVAMLVVSVVLLAFLLALGLVLLGAKGL